MVFRRGFLKNVCVLILSASCTDPSVETVILIYIQRPPSMATVKSVRLPSDSHHKRTRKENASTRDLAPENAICSLQKTSGLRQEKVTGKKLILHFKEGCLTCKDCIIKDKTLINALSMANKAAQKINVDDMKLKPKMEKDPEHSGY